MSRIEPQDDAVVDTELRLKPKCFTCGNSRNFYVLIGEEMSLWSTADPLPAGAKISACGRCRSRNSVIMDYSD